MPSGRVNVSVANLYRLPQYGSEIVSQALLGERCAVLENKTAFSRIALDDGYEGWISNRQWVDEQSRPDDRRRVRSHFLRLYENPDLRARPVRDAVIGTYLDVIEEEQEWLRVVLPDGIIGYAERRGFGPFPDLSREGIMQLALEFYGYPYYWGGRSPKGFDCSGFVQTVFALLDMKLPRDSWMQHRQGKPAGKKLLAARPADLLFFAGPEGKISHVGIVMGEGRIIHCQGMVCMNSLLQGASDFRQELLDSFVEVRTYFVQE
jgi:hypothetical protein